MMSLLLRPQCTGGAKPAPTRVQLFVFGVLLAAAAASVAAVASSAAGDESAWGPLALLGGSVEPGTVARLSIHASESFAGADVSIPVIVVRGAEPGRTLCLTAGVHGDEVNGVEVVRRIVDSVDAGSLRGTLIALPIVNLSAYRRGSRYLPDRRDLNRYFPGSGRGSSASRIAYAVFNGAIRHCDALIDIHTGSFHRTNLHQLRVDLAHAPSVDLARSFGADVVVHSDGSEGTLRRAAMERGIAAITLEAGEPARFSPQQVELGLQGVLRSMTELGMRDGEHPPVDQVFYGQSRWVRADAGGILVTDVTLGARVREGQQLATIADPLSNRIEPVVSPFAGRVVGMAFDQVVMPGFAAFHVAIEDGTPRVDLGPDDVAAEEHNDLDLDERPE